MIKPAMRYPKEQKAETRGRILRAAARLFRESGYDGVGVDAIMAEAGLTPGGFYAHFRSKEALFAEAMANALDPVNSMRSATITAFEGSRLNSLIKSYLSRNHRDSVAEGCPLPSLTSDVARKSDSTRYSYERQFMKFVREIEHLLSEGPRKSRPQSGNDSGESDDQKESRERALAIVAQCVGGLMLSRAVKDVKLSDCILRSCRAAALEIASEVTK